MRFTPYVALTGTTREAMEFYRSVFGGSLEITNGPDGSVRHAMLIGAAGPFLMAADSAAAPSVSIAVGGDEKELTDLWEQLSAGGQVEVPFARSAWGALFGRCTDSFGVTWLVNVNEEAS